MLVTIVSTIVKPTVEQCCNGYHEKNIIITLPFWIAIILKKKTILICVLPGAMQASLSIMKMNRKKNFKACLIIINKNKKLDEVLWGVTLV